MLPQVDFLSIKEKFNKTQKLLSRIDKELEQNKNIRLTDPHNFLEIINKTFQTYELCAQEFCFELELLQLSFVSVFFKHYLQGYHKFLNTFMKFSLEKLNTTSNIQRIITREQLSDSSRDSSASKNQRNPKTENKIIPSNQNNKVNLIENFSKIDQMTKVQMELDPKIKTKREKNDHLAVNMLPLTGRPSGVDSTTHRDRKSYTIQLLRVELLNQQSQNQTFSVKLQETSKKLEEAELAKRNLEEEILRLVKLEKTRQNDFTSQILSNEKNRVGGGWNTPRKSQFPNGNQRESSVFNAENSDINEYLKKIETSRKKVETKKPEDEELKKLIEYSETHKQINKMEQNEEEKQQLDEINEFMQQQQKTILNIKDSGVTKELKQFLRKMAQQKKGFSEISHEIVNEFDEISDNDTPMNKEKKKIEKKTIFLKKPQKNEKKLSKEWEPSPVIPKKKTADKATNPDPAIFDIGILDALKYSNEKMKSEIARLEDDNEILKKTARKLDEDYQKLKKQEQETNLKVLEFSSLKAAQNFEINNIKKQLQDSQKQTGVLEEKLKRKKAKINFFKKEAASQNSNPKQKEPNFKADLMEAKLDNERFKIEIKSLRTKIEVLNAEIEKLKKELEIKTDECLIAGEECEKINLAYSRVNETLTATKVQIKLLEDKNEMLEKLTNEFEESRKKLEEMKNSEKFSQEKESLEKVKNFVLLQEKKIEEEAALNSTTTPRPRINSKNNNENTSEMKNSKEIERSIEKNSQKKPQRYKNLGDKSQGKEKFMPKNEKKLEKENEKIKISSSEPKRKIIENNNSTRLKQHIVKNIEERKEKSEKNIDDESFLNEISQSQEKNSKSRNIAIKNNNLIEKTKSEQEKIIKNLQIRLENEIIQKEQLLEEKLILEQKLHLVNEKLPSQNFIISNDTTKNKHYLPLLTEEKSNQKNFSKNEPQNYQNVKKLIKSVDNINPQNIIKSIESKNSHNIQNYSSIQENNENDIMKKTNTKKEFINSSSSNNNFDNKMLSSFTNSKNISQKLNENINDKKINKSNLNSLDSEIAAEKNKFIDLNSKQFHFDDSNKKINNKTQIYKISKNNNESNNYKSLNKIDAVSRESENLPSFISEENLYMNTNNISYEQKNTSKFVNSKREEEKKKEEEKINIMFENLKDTVAIEGTDLLKNNQNPDLAKFFQKIINKEKEKNPEILEKNNISTTDLQLGIEDFKEIIDEIKNEHRRCGPNCIHLRRFYEKLGFSEKKLGKKIYYLHKRIINKLPQIS